MKKHKPSMCPFHVGRILLETHKSLCTIDEYNRLSGALRARDIKSICSFTSPARLSSEVHCLFFDQMRALFSKNAEFVSKTGDETAFSTFVINERRCRITSRRLDYYLFCYPHRLDEELSVVLYKAQTLIRHWLGSFDRFLGAIPEHVRTTGGATCNLPRSRTSAVEKSQMRQVVSVGCLPLARAYAAFVNKPLRFSVCNYNRLAFVPKNYKTARTIACEPSGLLPFQLACDALLKQRLSRVGVNLSDQTGNQTLSKHASIFGDLVTLDLANASDSLTIPVLEFLLPKQFFELFMRLRSSHFKSDHGCGRYSKFASMGNGITFPLETLVFASIVAAVGNNFKHLNCGVYGDDIIVPNAHYPLVTRVLRFIGFNLNHEKTYSIGPFRESCGTNWYRGHDVTPFYWRNTVRSRADIALVVNSLGALFPYNDELGKYFANVVKLERVPIIPPSGDSRAGVMVHISTAYAHRKIRYHNGLSYVRCLVSSPRNERRLLGANRYRGYYYWLNTRGSKGQAVSFLDTVGEDLEVPRCLSADIHPRYRLCKTVWHIADSHQSRHYWLDEYLFPA